jgi:DNA polymerase III alpha subunit (gram-positive type)
MRFVKDILVFDIQTTGSDAEKDVIVQLAGIGLSKDNLLEQEKFSSFVRTSLLEGTLQKHAELVGKDLETLRKSPRIQEVLKSFTARFSRDVTLCTNGVHNLLFLQQSFKKAGLPFPFEYQCIELWTLGYIYCAHYGLRKTPTLSTLTEVFQLPSPDYTNAFARCKTSADIFKKLTQAA